MSAMAEIAHRAFQNFGNQHEGLGAAHIDCRDEFLLLVCHSELLVSSFSLFVWHARSNKRCDLESMMQCRLDAYFSSSRATARIRIHDHLPVVAQIYGIELAELLPPFLSMRQIDLVALKEVAIAQVQQHR